MKYICILISIVIASILLSCKPRQEPQTTTSNETPPDTLSIAEIVEPVIEKPAIKHYFKNNIMLGAFFADSTSFRATQNGFNSRDFDIDPMQIIPSDQEYEEWDTFLSFGRVDIWDFFDDVGHIVPGWEMIHHHRIYSPLQITNFMTDISVIPPHKIKNITSSNLIFLPYTSKNPQKATSLEIVIESVDDELPIRDSYYTTPEPDEYQKLQAQATEKYRDLGIESIYLTDDEQYLSFNLYDGFKVFIDTAADQNGLPYTALLYRSGYIPILFRLQGSEEEYEIVQKYIDNGEKPFPSWKT